MINTVEGNLITMAKEGRFDAIVHGCNCMGIMGAGIAKQLADEFPEVAHADRGALALGRALPGSFSRAHINRDGMNFYVFNAYTQFLPGGPRAEKDTAEARLEWIRKAFRYMFTYAFEKDHRIGIPLIGAGIAGGDWTRISAAIEGEMTARYRKNLTLVILPKTR